MKGLKKGAQKIFEGANFKTLIAILLIKLATNVLLIGVGLATFYASLNVLKTTFPRVLGSLLFGVLIFTVLILMPLKMGIYLWLSETKKDSASPLLTVFHYYRNFRSIARVIIFEVLLIVRTSIIFILYFAPTVGTFLFACNKVYSAPKDGQLLIRLLILASATTILSSTIFFLKSIIMQIPAKFLFVMNPDKNPFSIIHSSSFLLRSNNKDFTRLLFSLWSYFFASIFIIPIPLTFAYIQACLCEFTRKIVYKQNQGIVAIPLSQMVIDINSRPL